MRPIKVHSRFATAHDTARTLGVSASRAEELIKMVSEQTKRMVHRDSSTGALTTREQADRNGPTVTGKGNRRNAHAPVKKASSKRLKARR